MKVVASQERNKECVPYFCGKLLRTDLIFQWYMLLLWSCSNILKIIYWLIKLQSFTVPYISTQSDFLFTKQKSLVLNTPTTMRKTLLLIVSSVFWSRSIFYLYSFFLWQSFFRKKNLLRMLCILIWKDFYDTLSSGKSNGRKLQIHLTRGKCKSILIWKCMKYLWRKSNKLVIMTTQSKQIEGMGIEKMKNRQKREPFHCTSFFNFLIFNPVKWLTTWKKKI